MGINNYIIMKKIFILLLLITSGIISAQRTFNYTVSRDENRTITSEGDANVTLSPMDANGYITITTSSKVTRYYTYDYDKGETNVGQEYISFKIRNTVTGEKFLLQMFNDYSLGVRIIDVLNGDNITLYDN
jgi:hypothetical protein